jgi:hypothetical protein
MINYKDEITEDFTEEDFEEIQSLLVNYLSKKKQGSLTEYILDFCEYYSYRIEDIAEIISRDKELKTLLKDDCVHYKIFRTEDNRIDDW